MAKYERGLMSGTLRFNLVLQTEDVITHSHVGDHNADFERMHDRIREFAQSQLEAHLAEVKAKKKIETRKDFAEHLAKETGA